MFVLTEISVQTLSVKMSVAAQVLRKTSDHKTWYVQCCLFLSCRMVKRVWWRRFSQETASTASSASWMSSQYVTHTSLYTDWRGWDVSPTDSPCTLCNIQTPWEMRCGCWAPLLPVTNALLLMSFTFTSWLIKSSLLAYTWVVIN